MIRSHTVSRRRFLARGVRLLSGTCAALATNRWALAQQAANPLQLPPLARKSVVVRAKSDFVADGPEVRSNVLEDMVGGMMTLLTREAALTDAWRRLIPPAARVGLRFDPYGDCDLHISEPVGRLLIESLLAAGWNTQQIILADAPDALAAEYDTPHRRVDWTGPVDFGSGKDQLAMFVRQVDVLINIALLKDDNILGLSGCLKNITYNLVKHPARCHDRGGTPYLADIYALPDIRSRLRLNIVNALRAVYHNGPLVAPEYVQPAGLLIMSTDPIAADAVALDSLNAIRDLHGLPPRQAPVLADAAAKGLGHIDFRKIERLTAGPF